MLFFRTLIAFLRDRAYRNLIVTTFIVLALGSIVYHYVEGWTWLDSFYFSVITLTTIGYGDFSPQTTGGKIFTIFYIIVGVGLILTFLNTFYQHFHVAQLQEREKTKKNKQL